MSELEDKDKKREELLKIEYQLCHAGYLARDQIVQDEFTKIIQVFSLLLTVLLAINIFVKVNEGLYIFFSIIIGITGFLALFALMIDLQSTWSVKVALRERCLEIESELGAYDVLVLWSRVNNRTRFKEEKILKGEAGNNLDRDEKEGNLFVLSSRIILLIWIVVVVALIFYGHTIQLSIK